MNNTFDSQKQRAIEEMLKMQQQAPPQENNPPKTNKPQSASQNSILGNLDIPILNRIKADGDLTLILGLLLLLMNEKADKRLMFALLYILL